MGIGKLCLGGVGVGFYWDCFVLDQRITRGDDRGELARLVMEVCLWASYLGSPGPASACVCVVCVFSKPVAKGQISRTENSRPCARGHSATMDRVDPKNLNRRVLCLPCGFLALSRREKMKLATAKNASHPPGAGVSTSDPLPAAVNASASRPFYQD